MSRKVLTVSVSRRQLIDARSKDEYRNPNDKEDRQTSTTLTADPILKLEAKMKRDRNDMVKRCLHHWTHSYKKLESMKSNKNFAEIAAQNNLPFSIINWYAKLRIPAFKQFDTELIAYEKHRRIVNKYFKYIDFDRLFACQNIKGLKDVIETERGKVEPLQQDYSYRIENYLTEIGKDRANELYRNLELLGSASNDIITEDFDEYIPQFYENECQHFIRLLFDKFDCGADTDDIFLQKRQEIKVKYSAEASSFNIYIYMKEINAFEDGEKEYIKIEILDDDRELQEKYTDPPVASEEDKDDIDKKMIRQLFERCEASQVHTNLLRSYGYDV